MKKNFKKTMAAVMAAALTLSLAGTAAEADAAKKAKFASKSVTVNVGKTKTVKIKNVKANKVKKLTVKSKSKKIATVSKKGKTAVKVKGKKKGTTKVTATLKIKGQKKATKLTLTVKVKKPTPSTVTPAPVAPTAAVTAAPPAPSAPAVTNAPSTGAPATGVPATTTPAGPTKVPTEKPTAKPPWTPAPDVRVQDVSIKYDYEFPGTRVVKFDGTVVNHDNAEDTETYENAKAEGYPKDGIDVRYYKKVIVKYEGKKLTGDGDWFGKATLSSTDEGLGQNEYADGLFLKYLNDVDTAGGYKDGVYTVEYDIDESKLVDGFDFEDVGLVDCFSVQLAAEDDYAGFKLLSADFIAPEYPVETADPNATTAPTQTPGTDTGSVDTGNVDTGNVDTGVVETAAPTAAPTQDPNKVVLKNSNVAITGNLTTADGAATTQVVENADGSITFYTDARTSGGGVHLYFDPVGKDAVDLSDYKEIKVTVKDESEEARQAVMELITGDITSWWSAKRESGIPAAYPFFGRDNATTETIDLSTATKKNIQGIMIKYNGYKQPADGATEAEQQACKASFTIKSVELVPKS